ncbi:MAG: hypothetical protein LBT97_02910 [Planctomycetota bacterium]|jgi:hypothetical protein|nr:hypothetical protein [Planctomycetota bacterium]
MGIIDDSNAKYRDAVSECSQAAIKKAKRIAGRGGWPRFYLYCTKDKRLALLTSDEADQQPAGDSELVTGESLPPSLPYEKYFQWVYERARYAPVL